MYGLTSLLLDGREKGFDKMEGEIMVQSGIISWERIFNVDRQQVVGTTTSCPYFSFRPKHTLIA